MLSIISTASTVHKALFRALVRPCAPVRLSATLVERQFFQAANIVSGLGLESAYCGSFSPSAWMTKVGKLGTRVVVLPLRAQNGHVFALNGFDHAQKGFACGIGAVLSRIGTFRPDHQAVFMRRKFRGHIKPVLQGCDM